MTAPSLQTTPAQPGEPTPPGTPVTAPEQPTAPTLSATQIPIIDPTTNQPYDLRNIDAATAARLLAQLPPEYQEQARQITELVTQFQSFSMIDVPQGFSFERDVMRYIQQVRQGATDFSNDPNVQWVHEHLRNLPLIRTAIQAGDGVVATGNFIGDLGEGFGRGNAALSKALQLFDVWRSSTLGGERISPEQATAFGAAYAAATYKAAQAGNQASTEPATTTTMDTIWSWVQWLSSTVVHLIPENLFGVNIPKFLVQFANACSRLIHGEGWNWDQAGAEATRDLQRDQEHLPTRADFEQRNTQERVRRAAAAIQTESRPDATATMVAAGSIAGIGHTADLARMVLNGGVYRDRDGKVFNARYSDGRLVREPVRGPDGQQLTLSDEYMQAGQNLGPANLTQAIGYVPGVAASTLPYVIPGYLTYTTTRGFYEGVLRAPGARLGTLEARAATLETRATALESGTASIWERLSSIGKTPEALREQAAALRLEAEPFKEAAAARAALPGAAPLVESATAATSRAAWRSPRAWARGAGEWMENTATRGANLLGHGISKIPGGSFLLRVGERGLARIGIRAGTGTMPVIGAVTSVGFSGYDIYEGITTHDTGRTINGGVSLGTVGAGAVIGSFICPGLGTLIGAGVGGVVGIFTGGGAEAIYDHFNPTPEQIAMRDRSDNNGQTQPTDTSGQQPQQPGQPQPGQPQQQTNNQPIRFDTGNFIRQQISAARLTSVQYGGSYTAPSAPPGPPPPAPTSPVLNGIFG